MRKDGSSVHRVPQRRSWPGSRIRNARSSDRGIHATQARVTVSVSATSNYTKPGCRRSPDADDQGSSRVMPYTQSAILAGARNSPFLPAIEDVCSLPDFL